MSKLRMSHVLILVLLLAACGSQESIRYPDTPTVEQTDTFFGTEVKDPYRWLEALDSPETRSWVEAENKVTFEYLAKLQGRERLKKELTDLWNYEKYGVPVRGGDRYFYSYNDGLRNQSVIYLLNALDSEPVQLLDPNSLSADGTIALTGYRISPDGELMAYGLASAGSDWQEWKVREVESGKDRPDNLNWIKFSTVSWSVDSKGFYYSRYDQPQGGEELSGTNYFQKVYYHQIGSPQAEDLLIYERPDQPKWLFGASVTDDGRYLIINVSQGTDTHNGVFYRDLKAKGGEISELLSQFDARYDFVGNEGSLFWFLTDLDAPRGKVIEIDIRNPARDLWEDRVEETEETLEAVTVLNRQFVCTYLKDAANQVKFFDHKGQLANQLGLPGLGSVRGFTGKQEDRETFYSYSSFTTPALTFHYDMKEQKSGLFRRPSVPFDPADFETSQVFFTSKDGTRVPMFITSRKGLKLDGNNPTILYGYGGFNISLRPSFSATNLVWIKEGGISARVNLRGGGEYGEEWHQAGMKLKKQNVFDDFIAAAEWLIENRYTTREKLAIEGASNGGLLVGAVLTQRPDLFGAAVPHVGVMDMLRFHKFTIGWAWVSDYGSPDNPEEFQALYSYSPYHNVKAGIEYPATLIITADHDDRVVPAHSFKFAAALQKAQAGPEPILIRIETRAGHGSGKPTSKRIEEAVDKLAFLEHELGTD